MTDKIVLNNVATFDNSVISSINTNNTTLTSALDNTLSRDGTGPNQMESTLDMNGNAIINLPAPVSSSSPARLTDVISNPTLALTIPPVGTSGSTVPLLNTNCTFSGNNTFSGNGTYTGSNSFSNTTTQPSVTFQGSSSGTTILQPSATASGTLTLPATTDTVVCQATADTLTNKTLTSPTLTTPSIGIATGTSLSVTGGLTAYSGTSIPSGGTAGSGIKMSSTSNLGIFFGSGAPTLSAAQGSLYIRTDGSSTSTRLYINTNGSTTWTTVTTAA